MYIFSHNLLYINCVFKLNMLFIIYVKCCIIRACRTAFPKRRSPTCMLSTSSSSARICSGSSTGCIKKTEQIWNYSQFRETAICVRFFIYIASLGTYNVEWEKFLELKFCEPGWCVFSNKLKMARAQNLKAAIIFWVNRWNICRVFNYCTKFQTFWFSLSPLTIHAKLHFS
jgi:hypothetical protein